MVPGVQPSNSKYGPVQSGLDRFLRWPHLSTATLGWFCIALGAGAVWIAREYPYGTLLEMGPGFIPTAIAIFLAFLGVLILILRGKDVKEDEIGAGGQTVSSHSPLEALKGAGRVMLLILGGIVVFGLTVRPLGLAPSTFLLVVIVSYAQPKAKPVFVAVMATVLTVVTCIVFVVLLGLSVSIFPRF